MIQSNWEIFSAKFSNDKELKFEWFSYLLFCREFDLPKGWFGFKNQSAIEKNPIHLGNEIIGFQAKFYTSSLSSHKIDFLEMLIKAKRDYPELTKILIYTNQLWAQAYCKREEKQKDPQTLTEINAKAQNLAISLEWREASFFESEFVCLENDDLAKYFFTEQPMQAWKRFEDWSNTKAEIQAEYLVDDNVKVIAPNHKNNNELNVIEGINEIRSKLKNASTSVRLVGLSGVGKTRFAQALFDERIGQNSLNCRDVWYCDLGESPIPLPTHFIDELVPQNRSFILIVDNCGQDTHALLTKKIQETKISLLTIEYDVKDDLPENTDVYKLKPISEEIVKKVIERHYPDIDDLNSRKIAGFSGGNYRLALAIASNIGRTDNIAVLTDGQLFERLFWQLGRSDDTLFKIAKTFALVYSFNVDDSGEENSELDFLANLAKVDSDIAIEAIEVLKSKDIVQQRSQWRAILPHAVANRLAKESISLKSVSYLNMHCQQMTPRLQQSFIKRLGYLHDHRKVQELVKSWFEFNGWLGKRLLEDTFNKQDLVYIHVLAAIDEEQLLCLLEEKNRRTPKFFTRENRHFVEISNLIRRLAYSEKNFKRAVDLLIIFTQDEREEERNNSTYELVASLFRLYTSESLANLEIKKNIISELSKANDYQSLILRVVSTALNFDEYGYSLKGYYEDGRASSYGYQPQSYDELMSWIDFLLNVLDEFDIQNVSKAREILVNHLKGIIWTCDQTDLVKEYLEKFNNRMYFSEAYLKVLNIIKFNIKDLDRNEPVIFLGLKEMELCLRPKNNKVSQLLQSYVIENGSYRFSNNCEDENKIEIPGFNSYDELIACISTELQDVGVLIENMELLINAKIVDGYNSYLEGLGENIGDTFNTVNECIKILGSTKKYDLLQESEFLFGIVQYFKKKSIDDYKDLINYLASNPKYENLVCDLVFKSSSGNCDFIYLSELLKTGKVICNRSLGLAWSKKFERISNEQFEIILDTIIELRIDKVICSELFQECNYQKEVASKYKDILLGCFDFIISESNFYDPKDVINYLLKYDDFTKEKVFKIVCNCFQQEKYISLSESDKKFKILKILIKSSTKKFINLFCEDTEFMKKFWRKDLRKILVYAIEEDVISWIDTDQNKLIFWIENSRLFITQDNNNIIWLDLLIELLNISKSPKESLSKVMEINIFEIRSAMGSWSAEMRRRLPSISSLKVKLVASHPELLTLVNQKEQEWLALISAQEKLDDQKNKERSERFDW